MNFTNVKNFMDFMAKERTPGNAIVVYKDGQKVFEYASGYSDLENQTLMTGEEMFYIFSASKVATITAGAQLLEQGKFLLNDPLYDYIPEFKDMYVKTPEGDIRKAQRRIRIGDLFSMTAGFTYDLNSAGFQKAREITNGQMDTVETIKCVASDPLAFEPGTHWAYSICHDVLAAVISVISGKKFRDYMKENIFEPLDIKDIAYHRTPEITERMAKNMSLFQTMMQTLTL